MHLQLTCDNPKSKGDNFFLKHSTQIMLQDFKGNRTHFVLLSFSVIATRIS